MEFPLLGPLEIVERGRSLALGAGKLEALLAILLLNANEVVSTESPTRFGWSHTVGAA